MSVPANVDVQISVSADNWAFGWIGGMSRPDLRREARSASAALPAGDL